MYSILETLDRQLHWLTLLQLLKYQQVCIMANKKVKIRKIRPSAQLPVKNNGNWYDCFVNKISLVRGDKLQKSFN